MTRLHVRRGWTRLNPLWFRVPPFRTCDLCAFAVLAMRQQLRVTQQFSRTRRRLSVQLSWTLLGSSIVPPCQNRLPDLVNTHWIRQPGHKYREMYSFSWNVTYRDRPWYLYCIKTHELSQIMSANNEERGKSSHAGSAAAVYRLPN